MLRLTRRKGWRFTVKTVEEMELAHHMQGMFATGRRDQFLDGAMADAHEDAMRIVEYVFYADNKPYIGGWYWEHYV